MDSSTYFARFKKSCILMLSRSEKMFTVNLLIVCSLQHLLFIRQVKKLISNLATMSNQGPNKFSMREYGSQRGTRGLRFLAYDWSADTNGII